MRHAKVLLASLLIVLVVVCARLASAAQGDCGQPVSGGSDPNATDALAVLRSAVGLQDCDLCVCDVDRSGTTVATDALATLQRAVGQPGSSLRCIACLVQAVVGPGGGSITSADGVITIDVPAGALDEPVTLSIAGVPRTQLPGPLAEDEAIVGYELGPDGLDFNGTVDVMALLERDPLAGGRLAAEIAVLITLVGQGIEVQADQGLLIDGDARTATAIATLQHFSTLVLVPVTITVAVDGLPEESAVDVEHTLTVSVVEDPEDEGIDAVGAAYTDDDFGAWGPVGGSITAAALQATGEDFTASFVYECSGQANVIYRTTLDTVYDIVADVPGAADGVMHRTLFEKAVQCTP